LTVDGKVLDTVAESLDGTGQVVREATTVRFFKLGLVPRLFHTVASSPVTYLLLVIGLSLLIFEFFTAGIGIAGLVGAICSVLACFGLAELPIRGVALVALALAARSATNNLFESNSAVTLALLFMLLTYAPMHIARGLSSGQGKFSNYALIIGLDGTIRVGVCAALWLSGVDSTGIYAVAVGLSPIVGVIIVAVRGDLRLTDGPPASWSEITPNLGWLLLASLFAAALVNAGPITVDILGSDEPAAVVTRFGNAVIFARVPLFLFQAVQAALLPKLARLAAQRDMVEFRTGLRRLILLVVGVGVVGTIGAFAIANSRERQRAVRAADAARVSLPPA
ncbi:MAG: hypothetical protein EBZ13_08150, partial [Planctomycetia bacterium]|nr:hypothetical protein [Planctomycetia bacterium]